LGGTAVLEAASREREANAEFAEDELVEDVQPMEPGRDHRPPCATAEVREVLAAANDDLAAQLKKETEKLLDSVLFTSSLER
jgi:dipeptidase